MIPRRKQNCQDEWDQLRLLSVLYLGLFSITLNFNGFECRRHWTNQSPSKSNQFLPVKVCLKRHMVNTNNRLTHIASCISLLFLRSLTCLRFGVIAYSGGSPLCCDPGSTAWLMRSALTIQRNNSRRRSLIYPPSWLWLSILRRPFS